MTKKFEIIRISGVATGVGFIDHLPEGEYSESVCETLYDTGNDEKSKINPKWDGDIKSKKQ